MGTDARTPDWAALLTLRDVQASLRRLPPSEVDASLSVALDALLLAGRLGSRWRICVAGVWVAYRVGLIIGRRGG